jgi:hypothetical protein
MSVVGQGVGLLLGSWQQTEAHWLPVTTTVAVVVSLVPVPCPCRDRCSNRAFGALVDEGGEGRPASRLRNRDCYPSDPG